MGENKITGECQGTNRESILKWTSECQVTDDRGGRPRSVAVVAHLFPRSVAPRTVGRNLKTFCPPSDRPPPQQRRVHRRGILRKYPRYSDLKGSITKELFHESREITQPWTRHDLFSYLRFHMANEYGINGMNFGR